jgi:DNA-binding response OmpR family regulator
LEDGEIPAPDANLIMLSVTLPDGNGIEICREITDEI